MSDKPKPETKVKKEEKPPTPPLTDVWELTHKPIGYRLAKGFAILRGAR